MLSSRLLRLFPLLFVCSLVVMSSGSSRKALAGVIGQMFGGTSPASAANASAVSAGWNYTCALTTAGGLQCWGNNWYGQLGDGTTTDRHTPVDVSGLTSGVATVAAGNFHACALTTAGGVECWGWNYYGELGDGTTTSSTTPVDVSGLSSGVAAVAAGAEHTCALTIQGGVKCWGYNADGELGDGTTTSSTTPVDVSGLTSGVAAVAAGAIRTCALTTAGSVKCWGSGYGLNPVDVCGAISGMAAVAAGDYHTCALTSGGGLKCWENNTYGQLGDGTTTWRTSPVDVSGLTSGVAAVAPGSIHTCALTTGGGVQCWGWNHDGQLGDGTTTSRHTPVNVSGLTGGVAAVAAGTNHTCALTTGGALKCWGDNSYGELGDGTTASRHIPVDVLFSGEPTPTATLTSTPGGPTPTYTATPAATVTPTYTPTATSTPLVGPQIDKTVNGRQCLVVASGDSVIYHWVVTNAGGEAFTADVNDDTHAALDNHCSSVAPGDTCEQSAQVALLTPGLVTDIASVEACSTGSGCSSASDSVTVNVLAPTPTRDPVAVGGIGEPPDDMKTTHGGGGPPVGAIAMLAGVAVVVAMAGGWYAQRRVGRQRR